MEELLRRMEEIKDQIEETQEQLTEINSNFIDIYYEMDLKEINKNCIKDIESLKREMRRDGLYTAKMEEFLDNFMRYYNH